MRENSGIREMSVCFQEGVLERAQERSCQAMMCWFSLAGSLCKALPESNAGDLSEVCFGCRLICFPVGFSRPNVQRATG